MENLLGFLIPLVSAIIPTSISSRVCQYQNPDFSPHFWGLGMGYQILTLGMGYQYPHCLGGGSQNPRFNLLFGSGPGALGIPLWKESR